MGEFGQLVLGKAAQLDLDVRLLMGVVSGQSRQAFYLGLDLSDGESIGSEIFGITCVEEAPLA